MSTKRLCLGICTCKYNREKEIKFTLNLDSEEIKFHWNVDFSAYSEDLISIENTEQFHPIIQTFKCCILAFRNPYY